MIDKKTLLGWEQAVTASAATTDILDLGARTDPFGSTDTPDLDVGVPKYFNVLVTTSATADGAATVTFSLETDSAEGFGSSTTLASTAAIGKASLTAGTTAWRVPIPAGCKRYLRGYFTVATGPLTAGKFTSWISTE